MLNKLIVLTTLYQLITCLIGTLALGIEHTGITIVSDETRFRTLHPDAELVAFSKERHAKGNFIFSAGEHISGDRLILVFRDSSQFTISEDIEDELRYTSKNESEVILTFVQIIADPTSAEADAYFFGGGINKSFADILLVCNQTQRYEYEIFIYGY